MLQALMKEASKTASTPSAPPLILNDLVQLLSSHSSGEPAENGSWTATLALSNIAYATDGSAAWPTLQDQGHVTCA